MWISDPTPVISSTKQMDSWSICSPMSTCSCPTGIQVNNRLVDDAVGSVAAEQVGEQRHAHPERPEGGGAAQPVPPGVGAPAAEQQDRGARQWQRHQQPGEVCHLGVLSL